MPLSIRLSAYLKREGHWFPSPKPPRRRRQATDKGWVTTRHLWWKYDHLAVDVLLRLCYISEMEIEQSLTARRYSLLKPLPSVQQYEELRNATFTKPLHELIENVVQEVQVAHSAITGWIASTENHNPSLSASRHFEVVHDYEARLALALERPLVVPEHLWSVPVCFPPSPRNTRNSISYRYRMNEVKLLLTTLIERYESDSDLRSRLFSQQLSAFLSNFEAFDYPNLISLTSR